MLYKTRYLKFIIIAALALSSSILAAEDSNEKLFLDLYSASIVEKIERVGKLYYPKTEYKGSVVLRYAINRDGSIRSVDIEKSSGYQILDSSAVNIVRKAAPFSPLPEGKLLDTNYVLIRRTFVFGPRKPQDNISR